MNPSRAGGRKRAVARQARQAVLWAAGLFVLAQLLGGLALDHLWPAVRFPQLAWVCADLLARSEPVSVLFLGSSRFGCGVNPAVVEAELAHAGLPGRAAYNASVTAGDAVAMEHILRRALAAGHRPDLVVVEVSPETLARRDNWLDQQVLRLLTWRDVPEAVPALCRNGRIKFLLRDRLMPLYTHRYQLRRQIVRALWSHPPEFSESGRAPVTEDVPPPPVPPERRRLLEASIPEITRQVRNYRVGGLTTCRLEQLVRRCRAAGVPVLLVGCPLSSPHRVPYTPAVESVYQGYLGWLAREHGCLLADFRARLADGYFVDSNHMNAAGSTVFSRQLTREVLAPLLRERTRTLAGGRAHP